MLDWKQHATCFMSPQAACDSYQSNEPQGLKGPFFCLNRVAGKDVFGCFGVKANFQEIQALVDSFLLAASQQKNI